uniref:hypothetical protein n=1 Tax=Aeromonas sp. Ne-1 TaxID=1675689 RepID=UPI001563DFE2|nr:hypothetical protein [Aeromonas sp. Ne-1]
MERINIISFFMYQENHPLLMEKAIELLKGEISLYDLYENPPIRDFIKKVEDKITTNNIDIDTDKLISFYFENI